MKIEQRSCPDRLGYAAVQINRVGWGAAFLLTGPAEVVFDGVWKA